MGAVDQAAEHPVRIVADDDRRLNRLTVFFRLILAIPHLVWLYAWTGIAELVLIIGWLAALIAGRLPEPFHRFLAAYLRYRTHLIAYLLFATNAYPGFLGERGYPVDAELPPPGPLVRWKVLLRICLVIPAAIVAGALSVLALGAAFLGWFVGIVRAEMPKGLRDAALYAVGYDLRLYAYFGLLTDRYPDANPTQVLAGVPPPLVHPVHIVGDADDLRRSRLTVFFRLVLAVPHLVWLYLWGFLASIAVFVQWLVTLIRGRPAEPLHRFLARYIRYSFHVSAFLFLAANPFPGFLGEPGLYPLDLVLPGPQPQNRWKTLFRLLLAIPAFIVSLGTTYALEAAAFLMWFVGLFTGRAPAGLRNLAAYSLRFQGQLNAYTYFLTDVYPQASPLEGAVAEPVTEPAIQAVA